VEVMRRIRNRRIKKQRKAIIISFVMILSLFAVGYGAFQTSLNVNVTGKVKIPTECVEGKVWEFEQKDEGQEFRIPCSGEYKVELWGAQGGNTIKAIGGPGGYTSGKINFKMNKKFYLYIGSIPTLEINSYNGGGDTNNVHYPTGDGGGATDIRIVNDNWDEFTSLKSRIMVAGAGGGSSDHEIGSSGGAAGGLIGYNGKYTGNLYLSASIPTGGTQISGGIRDNSSTTSETWRAINGKFGIGGHGDMSYGGGGGGSGYYGGGGGDNKRHVSTGGGGSSFISGHNGCNAISEQSTENNIIHTGQSIHYSGLYFTDTIMIDGAGYKWTDHKLEDLGVVGMPTHSGIGTMTGNEGDGFAKITLLTRKPN